MTASSRPLPAVTLALSGVSAAAATMHEVAWSHLLGRLVGNTSHGRGLALGLFMLGMGVGAALARTLLARGVGARRGYVGSEVTIALGGTAAAAFLCWSPLPSVMFGGGLSMDVFVSTIVMLPASLAIGMTYPFLVAVTSDEQGRPSAVTWLYLAGLVGGLIGVVVAGFEVLPRFGADHAAFGAAILNLVVAGWARVALPSAAKAGDEAGRYRAKLRSLQEPLLLFMAAGGLGLGSQVVWNRTITPYGGVSGFTFSTIVAAFLLGEAAGMGISRRLTSERAETAARWALLAAPAVLLLGLGLGPALGGNVVSREHGLAWLGVALSVVLPTVVPGAMLLGVIQAGALRRLEAREHGRGGAAAVVTGLGTAASAVAAVLTSLVLIPVVGPRWALVVLSAPLLAVGAMVHSHHGRAAWALAVSGVVVVAALRLGPDHFLGASYDASHVLRVDVGPQDTTAVVLHDRPTEPRIRHLVANGVSYSGDSLFAQRYMRSLGHLPALTAARRERALVICIGTGSTAGALLSHPFTRIDAVDISPSVRHTLTEFAHVHGGLPDSDRARISIADGVRFLETTPERWDVITLEPPPPRAPGASSLYSSELYRLALRRLTDGGVLAQWLPLHGLSSVELAAIVATFVAVFPQASLHMVERNEAVLLGGGEAAQLERSRPGRTEGQVLEDLSDIGFSSTDPVASTRVADAAALREASRGAALIRYAWPMPELSPLHGLGGEPGDAWLARLGRTRRRTADESVGALLLRIAPAFVRSRDGRARPGDAALVRDGMVEWLARGEDDPYVQHVFGYGALLEARVERLSAELNAAERNALRRGFVANRRQAEALRAARTAAP